MRVSRSVAIVLLPIGCATSAPVPVADVDASDNVPDTSTVPDAFRDAPVADASNPCADGIKDGTEADVDCGGTCPACADDSSCVLPSDCQSAVCSSGRCGTHAWFVESNGSNVSLPGNQTWVDGPGLTLSPRLHAASVVFMQWTGTSRWAGGGNGLCAIGQRFVVDGKPTGDPSWGDAIMVQRGSSRWHEAFTDEIAMSLSAGPHTIAVQATNGSSFGACALDGDGGLAYDRSRLAVSSHDPTSTWYAESTGETGELGPGAFTDIPGVSVLFNLADPRHVQMALSGTEHTQGSGSGHCAYRLVVDGSPLGDPNHGQAISVADVTGGWWAPVVLRYGQTLPAGPHSIGAQVSNSSNAGGTCNAGLGKNAYSRFHLLVTASLPGGAATSVESAGGSDVLGSTSAWTAVGGLQANFTVGAPSELLLELAATQRTMSGSGHCSWRYVIDGTALGDATYGQGINVGDGATAWWTATPLLWGQTFSAGSHTVSVEVRNSSTTGDCGTNADGLPYGRARLLVRAP